MRHPELSRRLSKLESRRQPWYIATRETPYEEVHRHLQHGENVALLLWHHEPEPVYAREWGEIQLSFGED